jgi:restriction endonuclease Mrr
LPQSAYELLRQLRESDPALTEKLLGLVYQKLDYRVSRRAAMGMVIERAGVSSGLQYSGPDQGKVGVKLVRRFREALNTAELEKGILITSEGFTRQARKLAATCGIEVLDETELTRLLEATGAGHDTAILAVLPNSRLAPAGRGGSLGTLTAAESR